MMILNIIIIILIMKFMNIVFLLWFIQIVFSSYQKEDFKDLGFVLHRVNHSIWFGSGNFHTNNIEGLWSQIKLISFNFSGININYLEKL